MVNPANVTRNKIIWLTHEDQRRMIKSMENHAKNINKIIRRNAKYFKS